MIRLKDGLLAQPFQQFLGAFDADIVIGGQLAGDGVDFRGGEARWR